MSALLETLGQAAMMLVAIGFILAPVWLWAIWCRWKDCYGRRKHGNL